MSVFGNIGNLSLNKKKYSKVLIILNGITMDSAQTYDQCKLSLLGKDIIENCKIIIPTARVRL